MDYTIDQLRHLTNEEWQIVLSHADRMRGRWRLIIVREVVRGQDRREMVLEMIASGIKAKDVATQLGISQGLVSKIKKGER